VEDKINEFETKSKNKENTVLCTGINKFKKCYQPGTNLGTDEKVDLADSHILKGKNYFFQLLNEYGVKGIRQTEIHRAEPLGPKSSPFRFTRLEKV
jgi:hypothetical protein